MRRMRLIRETKKRVNLRLEPSLVATLRRVAAREGKNYQSMVREWLWEKVEKAERV